MSTVSGEGIVSETVTAALTSRWVYHVTSRRQCTQEKPVLASFLIT